MTLIPRNFSKSNNLSDLLSKYWIVVFSVIYGLFVGIPFLAPVFMHWGWETPAKMIYTFYSFLCHQLPQRSFFLFGDQSMYSLEKFQTTWQIVNDPWALRKIIGNPEMGWKVAWSDRMVSMYSSILFAVWLWYPFRKKLKQVPYWVVGLLILPMVIDGGTHLISDFAGIGQGFRDSNQWLAALTNYRFSASFYAGDAVGSFNSWMRLITGTLFGVGIVLFGFPFVDEGFSEVSAQPGPKVNHPEGASAQAIKVISS